MSEMSERVKGLIEALKDGNEAVRRAAAEALGEMSPEVREALARLIMMHAVPALIVALTDTAATVRFAAAAALRQIGRAVVLPLIAAFQGGDFELRCWAAFVLGKFGPEAKDAVPALAEALKDEDEDTRRAAAWALGKIGPAARPALPALLRATNDPSAGIRWTAVKSVLAIRGS